MTPRQPLTRRGTQSQLIAGQVEVIFPLHPRTRKRLQYLGADPITKPGLHIVGPLPYLEFLGLQRRAQVVLTDSGGIQEETTFLGVPCLTLRENTERPITVSVGTNGVVGREMGLIRIELERVLNGLPRKGAIPSPLGWACRGAYREHP